MTPRERAARILALLLEAPDTARNLTRRLGENQTLRATDNVRDWLNTFHDFGVVYVKGVVPSGEEGNRRDARVWACQPSPFLHEDSTCYISRSRLNSASGRARSSSPAPSRSPFEKETRSSSAAT